MVERKLIVYYRIYSMSKQVASKGQWSKKAYRYKDGVEYFPEDMNPELACGAVLTAHGKRPEGVHLCTAHKFAEIIKYHVGTHATPETVTVKEEQPELCPAEPKTNSS